jgi:hypothetical protein
MTDLENENVLELHNLNRGEMLARLRLRTRFVGGDEEQSSVHHSGSVEHGGHQNVVTGAIDERDMTGRWDRGQRGVFCSAGGRQNSPKESHRSAASWHLAWWPILLV